LRKSKNSKKKFEDGSENLQIYSICIWLRTYLNGRCNNEKSNKKFIVRAIRNVSIYRKRTSQRTLVALFEVETVKFPHTLTVNASLFIKKEDLSLSTKSEGTRYRVVYLFKDVNVYDNKRKAQLISSQLQEATNLELPNSQNVAEVIAQPAQSSNETATERKVECPVCKKLCAAGQGI
jgi:hypothetical protein